MKAKSSDDREKLERMGVHVIPRWETSFVTLKSARIVHRERVDARCEMFVVHVHVHVRDRGEDERRALLVVTSSGEIRTCVLIRGGTSARAVGVALASLASAAVPRPAPPRDRAPSSTRSEA